MLKHNKMGKMEQKFKQYIGAVPFILISNNNYMDSPTE